MAGWSAGRRDAPPPLRPPPPAARPPHAMLGPFLTGAIVTLICAAIIASTGRPRR